MQVIDYYNCDRKEHWLEQIKKCDWGAGQFLYELLSENKFKDTVGETSEGGRHFYINKSYWII